MAEMIALTASVKYDTEADLWVAQVKGYSCKGTGYSPEEATEVLNQEIELLFQRKIASRRYVHVSTAVESVKVSVIVTIDETRASTLSEFEAIDRMEIPDPSGRTTSGGGQ